MGYKADSGKGGHWSVVYILKMVMCRKVLLDSAHRNGHSLGFYPKTQNLQHSTIQDESLVLSTELLTDKSWRPQIDTKAVA